MIRAVRHHGEYERNTGSRHLARLSCDTWFISIWAFECVTDADFGSVDLPTDAFFSQVVVHLPKATSIVHFSTEDVVAPERRDHDEDDELQLLDDTRAYLACLVHGTQPGSRFSQAWEQFFFVYSRRIRRAVRRRRLSACDAEDCVQEVWLVILEVLRQCGQERPWDRFSSWMHGLIRNQVANHVRRLTRRFASEARSLEIATFEQALDPATAFEQDERRRMVRHVLGHLEQQVSPTNYRLMYLRWIEGCEIPEVATRLDLTSDQIRYRHYRVTKRLRRLLELHEQTAE